MAFNKSKALESALKYLNQGKVNQAIAEYQQVLRNDAKDQATLMTVGDLFARQGDMPRALEYFERLAHVYLTDGFNSKAIAIYKKIAKLAPSEIVPLERLADLYVQQGVLSEARPLFLQIAEAHLKANRAPKAVEVLHRLLEVEPENPRVQMRLAELYNAMGQKGDAAKTYFAYAQRLFDRGDASEAEKLVERSLELLPSDSPALLLKAKILSSSGKDAAAIKILAGHSEADTGAEVTNLLVDLELKTGMMEAAAERARKQLVRGNAHFGLLFRVSETLVERGQVDEALPLFRVLRDPMIEAGEHDKFVKLLSAATERLPGNTEALELLADFCRHTSDPFPLTVTLTKLADIHEAAGNDGRAEQLLEELVDRNRDNERLAARLESLRMRTGKSPTAPASPEQRQEREPVPPVAAAPVIEESALDPETQSYVAQALTDVDLFSSYGLTQKATTLLETVLQRAPRHTPALERLLDLSLGAGDNQRTAQLASTLAQIHSDRGDRANAERFAALRKRYQAAANLTLEPLQPGAEVESVSVGAVPVGASPELAEGADALSSSPPEFVIEEASQTDTPAVVETAAPENEVDLSDEWEAMAQEVVDPPPASVAEASPPGAPEVEAAGTEVFEIRDEAAETDPPTLPLEFPDVPAVETTAAEAFEAPEFDLELTPERSETSSPSTTEEFIAGLAAEVEGLEPPQTVEVAVPALTNLWAEPSAPIAAASSEVQRPDPVPEPSTEGPNQLAEVFQEFRSELGELGEEDEDLETHYNLGIAYREMGLLEEAIGEFQKVAKAVQKGRPFAYVMNCATLLALSFRDKGEPKIASLWYKRALEVPGLDQEAILALRYDLGISLEMAGESDTALECFRQVYAMNIDYRDVADRIATLQHH